MLDLGLAERGAHVSDCMRRKKGEVGVESDASRQGQATLRFVCFIVSCVSFAERPAKKALASFGLLVSVSSLSVQ